MGVRSDSRRQFRWPWLVSFESFLNTPHGAHTDTRFSFHILFSNICAICLQNARRGAFGTSFALPPRLVQHLRHSRSTRRRWPSCQAMEWNCRRQFLLLTLRTHRLSLECRLDRPCSRWHFNLQLARIRYRHSSCNCHRLSANSDQDHLHLPGSWGPVQHHFF